MELARPPVARPLFVGCSMLVALAVPRVVAPSDHPARADIAAPLDYTAEQVIEAGIAAAGGRARLSQVVAYRSSGTLRDLSHDDATEHWQDHREWPGNIDYRDDSYAVVLHQDAQSAGEQEYENGSWHTITGGELDDDVIDARFDRDLEWRELFHDVRLLGVVEFDGQPAYAVHLVSHAGRTRTNFYSVTSHLEIGYEEELTIADRHHDDADAVPPEFTFRVSYSDFRNVNGVMLPFHSIRHAAAGYFDELERTWDSFEVELEPGAR